MLSVATISILPLLTVEKHLFSPIPLQQTTASPMLQPTSNKPDLVLKSSSSDLQSRLKVRKVLGVGDASGSICSSKISQILGQSDNFIFQLPSQLAAWLLFMAIFFSCFTMMGLFWPSCLRLILPGRAESTVHLAASYAFLATILGFTLRSGDKICLQLVLFSMCLFHALSFLLALWLLKTSDTKIKSIISIIFHLFCLLVNTHFYQSMKRSIHSSVRHNKLKTYFNSILSFPTISTTAEHESSEKGN